MKNKKPIIIGTLIAVALLVVTLSAFLINKSSTANLTKFNDKGISFNYFNSWKLSTKSNNKTDSTISLDKPSSSSSITISLRKLPLSYEAFTYSQIADAARYQFEAANKDYSCVYSGNTSIGPDKYDATQLLYQSKDRRLQIAIIAGKSKNTMFVMIMKTKMEDFDLMSYDLDAITQSFKID